jgi:hypothetical protein
MSLADFQRAFAVVVADPAGWAKRLHDPHATIGSLALTAVERARLQRILAHPGMAANHLLLRANRMMPIQGALPLTCDWLRDRLDAVLDAWLASSHDASVQYTREAARFARWLPGFLAHTDPALDALRYELALAKLAELVATGSRDVEVELRFDHDPDHVLAGWSTAPRPLAHPIVACLRVVDGDIVLSTPGTRT